MKKLYSILLLFAAVVMASCSSDSDVSSQTDTSESQTGVKKNSVTVMMYSVGGGDRDNKMVYKMRQAASVGATDLVNVTFQCKLSKSYQSNPTYNGYKGIFRMDLADAASLKGCSVHNVLDPDPWKNLDGLPCSEYDDASRDMSDPEVLSDFIKWSVEKHPAEKYVLVLADHGSGWNIIHDEQPLTRGINFDDNLEGSPGMPAKNIAEGIKKSGVNFEVLYLDACLMSTWEGMYEYKEAPLKYLVSSMELSVGGNFEFLLDDLIANSGDVHASFKKYIDDLMASVPGYRDLGIYDLTYIPTMTPLIKEIGDSLKSQLASDDATISSRAATAIRTGVMAESGKQTVPGVWGKKIVETYDLEVERGDYSVNSDGDYSEIEAEYVILFIKNHTDEWLALDDDTKETTITHLFGAHGSGLALGDVLKQYADCWNLVTSGYDAQKAAATRLYNSYVKNIKAMSYIVCTEHASSFDDQEYVETSPSVNIMALNETGWRAWDSTMGFYGNFNCISWAKTIGLSKAISLYSNSTFSKETGWVEMLKVNPYNPTIFTNDLRLTRYRTD